ncbi:hypothetical protein BLOT_014200 [Blomia tropicalis]|nr:hypothetical protein BLOT_014200 [Blomia tropicalis]
MEIMEQLSKLNIYLSNHYKLSMLLLNQLIKVSNETNNDHIMHIITSASSLLYRLSIYPLI